MNRLNQNDFLRFRLAANQEGLCGERRNRADLPAEGIGAGRLHANRLDDTIERGDVAKSPEINTWLVIAGQRRS